MPAPDLKIHPEALEEAQAGLAWYVERSQPAARRFLAEVEHALARIAEAPDSWPHYVAGTRRFLMVKFPYSVIYKASSQTIHVYAFAHARRRPGYWRDRVSPDANERG